MSEIQSSSGGCDVLLMAQGEAGCVRLLVHPGSIEVAVHAAGSLPLADRSVRRFLLDEAMGRLPVRERLHLLLECRRCLEPGGLVLPARPSSADGGADFSRWAVLVGLSEAGDLGVPWAWRNGPDIAGASPLVSIVTPASRALLQGDAAFLSARLSRFRVHPEQAQANPEIVNQSIKRIRALQQQWITLGLFRRFHPGYLEARRLGGAAEAGRTWSAQRLLWVQPSGDTPENEVRRWRETRRHPFDAEAP